VLGPPRSGTSAISSMLIKLGVDFGHPENFIDPTMYDYNPKGFFELVWANQLNDEIFSALGTRWPGADGPPVNDQLFSEDLFADQRLREFESRIREAVLNEWGHDSSLIGIKDPRISLLFPLWEAAVRGLGYEPKCVITLRDPLGFARSEGALAPKWTNERLLIEWLRDLLTPLYFARHNDCRVVDFDALISDPEKVVSEIALWLELPREGISEATAIIDRTFYHHARRGATGNRLVDRLYPCLQSSDGHIRNSESLEALYDDLLGLWSLLRSLNIQEDCRLEVAEQQIKQLRGHLGGLADRLASSEDALRLTRSELQQESLHSKQLADTVAQTSSDLARMSSELARTSSDLAQTQSHLAQTSTELARIKQTRGWRFLSLYGKVKYAFLLPVYNLVRHRKPGKQ